MEKASITPLAMKWFFFWSAGSFTIYAEFSHLFMKQLGFSPQQIGATNFFGILNFFIPLCLLFGDKFRARKTVTYITGVGVTISCFVPLLPLLVPIPTCFTATQVLNHSGDIFTIEHQLSNASLVVRNPVNHSIWKSQYPLKTSRSETQPSGYVPWLSSLFLLMAASKSLNTMLFCACLSCGNVATMTFLKEQKASYGEYVFWAHLSAGLSISTVALLVWCIKISICGVEGYGYFIIYIVSGGMAIFAIFSFPWFKFEYENNKLKSSIFDFHYAFIFLLLFYAGILYSFQIYWEFWYLDELSASPLIMGCAALVRRPFIALSTLMSVKLIGAIGELKTVCIAFFLYALSYLALSFTRIPWFVLGIDLFQAFAYGASYCAFMVHFSKAAPKESSGVIFGLMEAVFAFGFDAGSALMGSLFGALSTQLTLLIYSMSSSVVLIVLLLYTEFSKRANYEYKELAQESDKE